MDNNYEQFLRIKQVMAEQKSFQKMEDTCHDTVYDYDFFQNIEGEPKPDESEEQESREDDEGGQQ